MPVAPDDIARIDAATGQQVWLAMRTIPTPAPEHVCVHGNTVYGFEGSITTPKVLTAWDLDTGARRYSSAALPGDGDQEIPFTIAPDGTIYVKRDGAAGLLHAFVDNGNAITQRWAVPINFGGTVAQIGVGLDGSVYVPDGKPARAASTRSPAPRSIARSRSSPRPRSTRARDRRRRHDLLRNGGSADGRLYAVAPDLSVLWSEWWVGWCMEAPRSGRAGGSRLSGGGTFLRVYRRAWPGRPR